MIEGAPWSCGVGLVLEDECCGVGSCFRCASLWTFRNLIESSLLYVVCPANPVILAAVVVTKSIVRKVPRVHNMTRT